MYHINETIACSDDLQYVSVCFLNGADNLRHKICRMVTIVVHESYSINQEVLEQLCCSFFSVSELQEEGKHAIEAPTSPTVPDIGPEGYTLGKTVVQRTRFI